MIHVEVQICAAEEWMGVVKEDLAMALDPIGQAIVSDIQPAKEECTFILHLNVHAPPDSEQRVRQALNAYLRKYRDLRFISLKAEYPVQMQF